MISNMCIPLLLTLLLSAAPTAARTAPATRPPGNPERVIVQIELMSSVVAATQPVAFPQEKLPADAKLVSSARTVAFARAPFLCDVANPGGLRTTLTGEARPDASGVYWQLQLSYAFRSADGVHAASSNIMLKPDQPMLLGGTTGGSESRIVVITLVSPERSDAAAAVE